jgi:hypothetical protein
VTKIEHSSTYKVGTGDIRLQVTIGDGQLGSSRAVVGSKQFDAAGKLDEVVGKGSDLAGQKLTVRSTVTDTNKQTNNTSVTYRLTGGPGTFEETLTFTVENERDSVGYKAVFELV